MSNLDNKFMLVALAKPIQDMVLCVALIVLTALFTSQGARIETFCDGDWWESLVVQVRGDRVMIHYVGGDEDEDEWINKDSIRLRPSEVAEEKKSSKNSRKRATSDQAEFIKQGSACKVEMDNNGTTNVAEHRPIRRSRILSDDARLAMILQEQDDRASKSRSVGNFGEKQRVHDCSSSVRNGLATLKTASQLSDANSSASMRATKLRIDEKTTAVVLDSMKSKPSLVHTDSGRKQGIEKQSKGLTLHPPKKASVPPNNGCVARNQSESFKASSGSGGNISVRVVPDENTTWSEGTPFLRKSRMTLHEDAVIHSIKHHIVDEVAPELNVAELELRTPSGLLLGQDHSLRYVRAVLWPPSRGEFVLKFSLRKTQIL